MTFAFMSERGAEEFVDFIATEFDLDIEVGSYLHVEIDDSDLDEEDHEAMEWLAYEAKKLGAQDVLL
jgi:hypothetical protein